MLRLTVPIVTTTALLAVAGCTDQQPPKADGTPSAASSSPEVQDERFAKKSPSVEALKSVCEDAVRSTSKAIVKTAVKVSWTWPSKHVPDSVRCYNGFDSTVKGPKHPYGVTEVAVWVELRPHLDAEREAMLPPDEQQTSCDLLAELSKSQARQEAEVAGTEVCTVRHPESRETRYRALSGYIGRSTVVTVGTIGFVRVPRGGNRNETGVDPSFTNDVHDALLEAVVKGFKNAR
ncbi:MAG: hypothetical protein ACRDTU_22185 [Micromonosporaceae bacterium]